MSADSREPSVEATLPGDQTQEVSSVGLNSAAAAALSSSAAAQIALSSEAYAVGREIAHGGMGSVLEAEDRKLGRVVAMKVMRLEGSASESARARFVREASVLARLEHPNIVPIHELGWDAQNRPYYTMKLVQGRTLQAVLDGLKRRDPEFVAHYTLDRLLTIFRKVCDAMSLAHAKGVIHRDLKPENIMVGEFGAVLVMDWGLARILADAGQAAAEAAQRAETIAPGSGARFRDLAEKTGHHTGAVTLDGAVMGTPRYMSPEQAAGHVGEIDQQSDVFSLGGILYAILTLHPPVEGKDVQEILDRIRGGQILSPTVYNVSVKSSAKAAGLSLEQEAANPKKFEPLPHCPGSRVPAALSAVTMRALAVEKSGRYKTVAEFAGDIEKYQNGFATTAEHAGLFTQLKLLVARHKREFAVAAAAWLVITGLAVWFVINLRAKERRAVASEQIAKDEATRATNAEHVAKDEATRATSAEQSAKAAEAVAVMEKESARQALAKSALSLAEAARRESNGPDMQAALGDVPDDLRDPTWRYLLDQSDTSIAHLHPADPKRKFEDAAADPRRPGVFAVIDDVNSVSLIDVHNGARLSGFAAAGSSNATQRTLAISPDGKRIAVSRRSPGGIVIHSATDGKLLLEWDCATLDRLQFSADGKFLLSDGSRNQDVNVWDSTTGKLAWSYLKPEQSIRARGAFTPDGQQVVTYSDKDGFRAVNAADGTFVRGFKGKHYPQLYVIGPHNLLACAGQFGDVTVYDLKDGQIVADWRPSSHSVAFLAFSPDGEQVLTATQFVDGRQSINVWQTRSGEYVRSLLGGAGAIHGGAIHPLTGELVLCGPNTRAWSPAGQPPLASIKVIHHGCFAYFWGSDDVLFAAGNGEECALQRLQPGGASLLWKSATFPPAHVEVSADGKTVVLYSGPTDKQSRVAVVRNAGATPEEVSNTTVPYRFTHLRLSPGGDRAVFVRGDSEPTYDVVDPLTCKVIVKLDRTLLKRCWDLSWVSEKEILGLVTTAAQRGSPGSEERIVIWDATTGKIVRSVINRSALGELAIAPDGKRFAEAGADKIVRIRDVATLSVLREFRAHDDSITAIGWNPAKPILATGSADLTVKLWNVDTGQSLEEFRVPSRPPGSLSFSPTGRRLVCSADSDDTRIWEPQSLSDRPAGTQPAGDWEDLLAALTPEGVEQTGNGWRLEDGALFSPATPFTKLPLPGRFAGSSYQLRVKLRKLGKGDLLHLDFPVGTHQASFSLDSPKYKDFLTGLVDHTLNELPGAIHGQVVTDLQQHDLELSVQVFNVKGIITATFDGQPLYEWTGPASALKTNSKWKSEPGTINLGSSAANWVVYEVKAKRQ